MSSNKTVLNNGQQAITNYDLSKIFIWNNRYRNETLVDSLYDPWNLVAGTVMGRITGTGTIIPCSSKASDGSQNAIGVLAADIIVNDGTTVTVPLCIAGDVANDQLVFLGSDTLDTIVYDNGVGKSMRDRLVANSGIILVANNF